MKQWRKPRFGMLNDWGVEAVLAESGDSAWGQKRFCGFREVILVAP